MRLNRQLAPVYRGLYDWIERGRHIVSDDAALCGLPWPDQKPSFGLLYQHECCARCWQIWRRKQGDDVRDYWTRP